MDKAIRYQCFGCDRPDAVSWKPHLNNWVCRFCGARFNEKMEKIFI